MGLRRGTARMAGGHDGRSAVAQAGSQERSVSAYPISMISARSSRAGKLRRRAFAARGLSCARSRDSSAGESQGVAAECDLISRDLFSFGVSAARGGLYHDARAVARAVTEAKAAEIGTIVALHRVPVLQSAIRWLRRSNRVRVCHWAGCLPPENHIAWHACAGRATLLGIPAGIYQPVSGIVRFQGRVD